MPKTNFCNPDKKVKNQEKFNDSQNTYLNIEKELKNKKFIQLYDDNNEYLLELMQTNTTASRVFLFLARYAESNNTIDITIQELAKIFKYKELAIKRALKTLEDYNFLCKIKIGKRNIYFINPQIAYNNIAEFKQKLINVYVEITGSSTINMELNTIDLKALEEFTTRAKITYRFALTTKKFQKPTTEEELQSMKKRENLEKDFEEHQKELFEQLEKIKQEIETKKIELNNLNKLEEEHKENQQPITEDEIFQAEFFMDFEDSLDMF